MNHWQATFLGLKQLPRELSGFEVEAFFTFTASERALIEARRGPSLKLGLALQIGFLRMSGRVLDAVRIVPPALWKHLGSQFGESAAAGTAARGRCQGALQLADARCRVECLAGGAHSQLSDAHRGYQYAGRIPLPHRAVRRPTAAVTGPSKDPWFGAINRHRQGRKILTLMSNRNALAIIELRFGPQKTPGNTSCFYHHFWKQK